MSQTNEDPREMTKREYREQIENEANAAIKLLNEEGFHETLEDAVKAGIEGSKMITESGYQLMTLFHTSQSPDEPLHGQKWNQKTEQENTSSNEAIKQMAYTIFYSEVLDKAIELKEE